MIIAALLTFALLLAAWMVAPSGPRARRGVDHAPATLPMAEAA